MEKLQFHYPCQKYIVRNLTSENKFKEYEKIFLSKYMQDGLSAEDMACAFESTTHYLLSSEDNESINREWFHMNPDTVIELSVRLNNSNIGDANITDCRSLYQKYDKTCSVCATCIHNQMTDKKHCYKNANYKKEAAILKYILSGNIDQYKTVSRKLTEKDFTYCYDAAQDLKQRVACVIPAFSMIFSALTSLEYEFFCNKTDQTNNYAILKDKLLLMIRNDKKRSVLLSEQNWKIIFEIVIADILSGEDIGSDDIAIYIEETAQTSSANRKKTASSGTRKKTTATKYDPVFEETDFFPELNEVSFDGQDPVTPDADDKNNYPEKITDSSGQNAGSLPVVITDSPDNMQETDEASDSEDSLREINDKEDPCLSVPHALILYEPPKDPKTKFHSSRSDTIVEASQYRVIEETAPHVSPRKTPDDIVPHFTIKTSELKGIQQITDDSGDFSIECVSKIWGTGKNRIYLEIVPDEYGKYLFLLYLPSKHITTYVYIDDKEKMDIIKPYLEQNRYQKICFSPYLLYSVCMIYHISIKNLVSIMTSHFVLEPGTNIVEYADILRMYEPNIELQCPEHSCVYLYGMRLYRGAWKSLSEMIGDPESNEWYASQCRLDEALGRSYLRTRYLKTASPYLFKMKSPKGYKFLPYADAGTSSGGVITSYVLSKTDRRGMILNHTIQELSSDGRFRRWPMILLSLTKEKLVLYFDITAIDKAYAETQIHDYIVRNISKYLPNENVHIDHKDIYLRASGPDHASLSIQPDSANDESSDT